MALTRRTGSVPARARNIKNNGCMIPVLKFLQTIQLTAQAVATHNEKDPAYLEGADLALLLVQDHLQAQSVFNPAQVGHKKAEARRLKHHRELQKLADDLQHEREAHAKTKKALEKATVSSDEDGQALTYAQVRERLLSATASVKQLSKQVQEYKKQFGALSTKPKYWLVKPTPTE